jgi:small subunit ribosomal protein S3
MGQKTHPKGFRLKLKKDWDSRWYANKQEFGHHLEEDFKIRSYLMSLPINSGTSKILIRRMSEKIEVVICTSRPGLVIGKKGSEIEALKAKLSRMTGKEVYVEVEEIKRPDLEARIVSGVIAGKLKKRVSFRKAMKSAIQSTMDAGALGIKVQASGRLGGAEIARTEWYKEGSVPLHTLRADVDYATCRAETTYGTIGVKVWIYRGELKLPKKEAV